MIKPPTDGPSDTPPGDPDDGSPDRDDGAKPESAASESKSGEVADAIGRQLRSLYDDIAAEPVSDRLRQLIDELERKSDETK
jgi:hypothetical protein